MKPKFNLGIAGGRAGFWVAPCVCCHGVATWSRRETFSRLHLCPGWGEGCSRRYCCRDLGHVCEVLRLFWQDPGGVSEADQGAGLRFKWVPQARIGSHSCCEPQLHAILQHACVHVLRRLRLPWPVLNPGSLPIAFVQTVETSYQEPLPVLDDIIASLPQIASQVVETAGADIQKEDVLGVEGVVYIYVGAGVTAGVYLGWVDTSGYRMIGAEGTIATGAGLGVTLRAGMNEDKMAVRVVAYLSNVGFDIIVKYPQPQGK